MKVKNTFLIFDVVALISIIILRAITTILKNDILYGVFIGVFCLLIILSFFDVIIYKGDKNV